MAEKVFKMTAEGKAQLEAELDSLKTEGRIDIAEKLKVARSYGDLSENSEYDEAKSEQAKIEARINELEYQLEHAEIIGAPEKGSVSLGSKVTVILLGERPGLATGESMSAYMTYGGYVGIPEASRTVVSNIHRGGTNPAEAGAFIAELCGRMLKEKASGLALKL